jgi:hypothetical protein
MSVKWLDMCIYFSRCLSFCTFSFGHCVVCSSSIYGFWLPLRKNKRQEIPECRNISKIKYLNNRKRENRHTTSLAWYMHCNEKCRHLITVMDRYITIKYKRKKTKTKEMFRHSGISCLLFFLLLRFVDSSYPFGIFKRSLHVHLLCQYSVIKCR